MIAFDITSNTKDTDKQSSSTQSQKANGDLFSQLLNHTLNKQELPKKQENVADLFSLQKEQSKKINTLPNHDNEKQNQFYSRLLQAQIKQERKGDMEQKLTPNSLLTQLLKKPNDSRNTQNQASEIQSIKQKKIHSQVNNHFHNTKQQLENITFERLAPEVSEKTLNAKNSSFSKDNIKENLSKLLEFASKEDIKKMLEEITSMKDFKSKIKHSSLTKDPKDNIKENLSKLLEFASKEDIKKMLEEITSMKDFKSKTTLVPNIQEIKDKFNSSLNLSEKDLEVIAKEKFIQTLLDNNKGKTLTHKEVLWLKNQSQTLPLTEALIIPSKEMSVLKKMFNNSKMSLSLLQEIIGKKESSFTLKDIEKLTRFSELNLKKINFSKENTDNPIPSMRYQERLSPNATLNTILQKEMPLNVKQNISGTKEIKNPYTTTQEISHSKLTQNILGSKDTLSQKSQNSNQTLQDTLTQQNEFIKQAIHQKKKELEDKKIPTSKITTKDKKLAEEASLIQKTEHSSYKTPNSSSYEASKEISAQELQAKAEPGEYDKKMLHAQFEQKTKERNIILSNMLKTTTQKQAISASMLDILGEKVKKENKEKDTQVSIVGGSDVKREFIYKSVAAKETLKNFTSSLKEGINHYKPPLSKLSLELAPENLGNVEVTIKQRGTSLVVQIHSNPQALQLFMANAQDFKQQLFGAGFENVDMTFQDSQGNSFSSTDGEGGGDYQGQNHKDQHEEDPESEALTQIEEMLLRQELQNKETSHGKIWNSFGLRAYKNSVNISNRLRLIELTLKPRYA